MVELETHKHAQFLMSLSELLYTGWVHCCTPDSLPVTNQVLKATQSNNHAQNLTVLHLPTDPQVNSRMWQRSGANIKTNKHQNKHQTSNITGSPHSTSPTHVLSRCPSQNMIKLIVLIYWLKIHEGKLTLPAQLGFFVSVRSRVIRIL